MSDILKCNERDIVNEVKKIAYMLGKRLDLLCAKYEHRGCKGCPFSVEGGICDSVSEISRLNYKGIMNYDNYEEYLKSYLDTLLTSYTDVEVVYLVKDKNSLFSDNNYYIYMYTSDISDVLESLNMRLDINGKTRKFLEKDGIDVDIVVEELSELEHLETVLSYGNYEVVKKIERV